MDRRERRREHRSRDTLRFNDLIGKKLKEIFLFDRSYYGLDSNNFQVSQHNNNSFDLRLKLEGHDGNNGYVTARNSFS